MILLQSLLFVSVTFWRSLYTHWWNLVTKLLNTIINNFYLPGEKDTVSYVKGFYFLKNVFQKEGGRNTEWACSNLLVHSPKACLQGLENGAGNSIKVSLGFQEPSNWSYLPRSALARSYSWEQDTGIETRCLNCQAKGLPLKAYFQCSSTCYLSNIILHVMI